MTPAQFNRKQLNVNGPGADVVKHPGKCPTCMIYWDHAHGCPTGELERQQALVLLNQGLPFAVASRLNVIVGQDEDLRQTLMLGLCVAASKYSAEQGDFATFAWHVVRRQLLRELKDRRRQCRRRDAEWLAMATAGHDQAPSPERQAEGNEIARMFQERFSKLDPRRRAIAEQSTELQLDRVDLVKRTGVKKGTLGTLKRETKAALQPLRKLLT